MTDYSFFEFYPDEPSPRWNIRCRFGEGQIQTTGGMGVWETVKRPYLPPLTVWRGPAEPYTHKIPAILDGWSDSNGVAQAVGEIESMAGLTLGEVPEEPPPLILNGYGTIEHDVVHNPKLRWVIAEPPEWGERVRTASGLLVRQAFTITFSIRTVDTQLERVKGKPAKQRIGPPAKNNETFEQYAHRVLHHAQWGLRLARLNGRQHANEHLHTGQTPLLPSKKQEEEWKKR